MTNYDDIINLPHHVSKKHTPMPMIKRAAQFAPFSALTGYDEAVEETARATEDFVTLTEEETEGINRTIVEAMNAGQELCLRYFEPDKSKAGGEYMTVVGTIKKIGNGEIRLNDGKRLKIEFIVGAERNSSVSF